MNLTASIHLYDDDTIWGVPVAEGGRVGLMFGGATIIGYVAQFERLVELAREIAAQPYLEAAE